MSSKSREEVGDGGGRRLGESTVFFYTDADVAYPGPT